MKKIVLLCANGMSTSMLVNKIKEAASADNYGLTVEAHPVSLIKEKAQDADMVFLAPQVGYQLNNVRQDVTCPVESIDMMAYGMMDGKSILKRFKEVVG